MKVRLQYRFSSIEYTDHILNRDLFNLFFFLLGSSGFVGVLSFFLYNGVKFSFLYVSLFDACSRCHIVCLARFNRDKIKF